MAKKIQAWVELGPRVVLGDPMTEDELIENIIAGTNQSKGSVLAALAEMDVQIEAALKAGRIVHLPNGTHFEPVGKKDGSIDIKTRISPELDKKVNAGFRGKWLNAENKGKSEAEIMALWNEKHPEDPID
jgi:nucleoid DNA-binding protein